eukprot:NODE_2942_length_966_cov_31.139452_g2922_i0.p1 GENE.NODE_2942_length_966_cov_31.139452_g2922_i0~~NODE_2942_length_966_cov_31.139452_g2922_i0.p1  ORF type:complete len:228 (-),score=53.52 NODE_2942_length_966_cov_31.139452_g2922_i0:282-899(-)
MIEKTKKVNKLALERQRNWKKFGKALDNDPSITVQDRDPVLFDISGTRKASAAERTIDKEIDKMLLTEIAGGAAFKARSLRGGAAAAADKPADSEPAASSGAPGRYVAPGRRGDGATMGREQEHTVRVTNLSENIAEQDLRDLFSRYGALQRVYLVKDKETGRSKGFAFVTFHRREDGEKAIQKVTGFGYDHLILQVDWARPRDS